LGLDGELLVSGILGLAARHTGSDIGLEHTIWMTNYLGIDYLYPLLIRNMELHGMAHYETVVFGCSGILFGDADGLDELEEEYERICRREWVMVFFNIFEFAITAVLIGEADIRSDCIWRLLQIDLRVKGGSAHFGFMRITYVGRCGVLVSYKRVSGHSIVESRVLQFHSCGLEEKGYKP
jgi:hypothetical protein